MEKMCIRDRKVYDTFMEKLPATILLTVSSMIVTMLTAVSYTHLELQKLGVDIEYGGEKGDLFYLDLYGFRQ